MNLIAAWSEWSNTDRTIMVIVGEPSLEIAIHNLRIK